MHAGAVAVVSVSGTISAMTDTDDSFSTRDLTRGSLMFYGTAGEFCWIDSVISNI